MQMNSQPRFELKQKAQNHEVGRIFTRLGNGSLSYKNNERAKSYWEKCKSLVSNIFGNFGDFGNFW